MQTLEHLLADYHLPPQNLKISITGLSIDSRTLQSGNVFLAYSGVSSDGRHYMTSAAKQGAAAILYEPADFIAPDNLGIPLIPFAGLREHIGALAARWFNYPTRELQVYAVTGTNGKTSCSHYLAQSLTALAQPCAVMGTVGVGMPQQLQSSTLTTPDALTVQQLADAMRHRGAHALAMEVSSHALIQGRVNCVNFKTAIFTNLTHDHLDYHQTMSAYGAAKAQLFYWPSLLHAVINLDDPFGATLFSELLRGPELDVVGYTTQDSFPVQDKMGKHKRVSAQQITVGIEGLRAYVVTPWGEGWLQCQLLGQFNLANILAVLTALCMNGYSLSAVLAVLQQVSAVPGRMQCFGGGSQPLVVIDYAHTPDALEKVLRTLRAYAPNKLWCVFGCGGDRDPTKRPVMGKVVSENSDNIIITNDNPRTENPEKIVADIRMGIPAMQSIEVEYDRALAITNTIQAAQAGDIVLIAGKGHEDYQIIGTEKLHFSDAEVIITALK